MSARSSTTRSLRDISRGEKRTLALVFSGCIVAIVVLVMLPPHAQHVGLSFLFMVIMVFMTIANGARAVVARRSGNVALTVLFGILALLCFALSFAGFGWVCNAVEPPA
jgi:hypothetical protein